MTEPTDEALSLTGFEKCEFEPDNDPCEQCKQTNVQLYFGNPDYWTPTDGDYWCGSCVIAEAVEISKEEKQ